jgi:peptide/nickel transport system substrate-binding protein
MRVGRGGRRRERAGRSGFQPVEGGTLIFGAEQEPTEGLNGELACCGLFWNTFIIESPVLEGAYEPQPDFTYKPNLIEGEAELTEDPFTLTYTIKEGAQWSDGTPISAQDFEFTWQTYVDPDNEVGSRAGYEQIKSAEILDDKTVAGSGQRGADPLV